MLERTRMSGSLDALSFGTLLTSAAIILSLVTVLACLGRGSERLKALPPAAKPVAGDWDVSSTTSTDTCNLGSNVHPFQGFPFFSIVENGTSLIIGGVCCAPPWGTGMTDEKIVTIQSNWTISSSPTCSWQIDEVDTGTLDATGDEFSGGANLTVSAVGDCGSGFPCAIQGTFTAERCVIANCAAFCPYNGCPLPQPLPSPQG